jgi:hypothetical protein
MASSSTSPAWGGGGGSPYTYNCPSGSFIKRFYGGSGNLLDQVCIECSNGQTFCAGGNTGASWTSATCPTGMNNFAVSAGQKVDAIFVPNCGDDLPVDRKGGGGGTFNSWQCPTPMVATGIQGRSGQYVDNVGFRCTNLCTDESGSFLSSPKCQDWCRTSDGQCDRAAEAYCKANPTDTKFCGCYNYSKTPKDPALQNKGIPISDYPYCFATECATNSSAYKPYNFIHPGTCPSQTITVCSADMNQTAGTAATMKGIKVVQNCSADSKTTSDSKNTTDSSSTHEQTSEEENKDKSVSREKINVALIGGISLISCCFIMFLMLLVIS